MIAIEHLREMRRRGFAPGKVYVDLDFEMQYGKLVPFSANAPHLHIGPSVNARTLDLRCLKDLDVQVNGFDAQRIEQVALAVEQAEPSRLITVRHSTFGEGEWISFPIVEVTDSKGIVTWKD
jgi:hypothetical protein